MEALFRTELGICVYQIIQVLTPSHVDILGGPPRSGHMRCLYPGIEIRGVVIIKLSYGGRDECEEFARYGKTLIPISDGDIAYHAVGLEGGCAYPVCHLVPRYDPALFPIHGLSFDIDRNACLG